MLVPVPVLVLGTRTSCKYLHYFSSSKEQEQHWSVNIGKHEQTWVNLGSIHG